MSDIFNKTSKTGVAGEHLVQEYFDLTQRNFPTRLEWLPYTTANENFQLHYGDCIIHVGDIKKYFAEIKTEKAEKYGNLFIEIWSNKSIGREGWFHNLTHTDLLYYVFLREQLIYVVDFKKLKAFDLSKYPLKLQTTHEQENDSWGYCVPIIELKMAGVIIAVRNMKDIREAD